MTHFVNSLWLPLLWPVVLRGTLLMMVGAALVYFARPSSALRHRVGVLTFAGLLLLPLLSALVPGISIELPWPQRLIAIPPSPSTFSKAQLTAHPESASPQAQVRMPSDSSVPGVATLSTPFSPSRWADIVPPLLFVVWLMGVASVLWRMQRGFAAAWRLQAQECRRLDGGPLVEQVAHLSQGLGIYRPVALYLANDEAGVMPMTWGWRSPRLLLPAGATTWSRERLHCVLLHELWHVRRGDWTTQCLANLCCALYWFHPLAWMAFTRLKADAEAATDEQVVAGGIKASSYCTHLLELARLTPQGDYSTRFTASGVPMARAGGVESRLHALLDNRRQRRGVSRFSALMVMGSFCGVFVGLIAIQPKLNVIGGNAKPTLEQVQLIRYPVSSTRFDTRVEVVLRYPLNKLFGRSPSWDGSIVKIIDGKGKVVLQMVYTKNHFAESQGINRYVVPVEFYWSQLPPSGKVTLKGSINIDKQWTFPITTTLRD